MAKILTDEEVLNLTTMPFEGVDGEVKVLLDDITIIQENVISVNGETHTLSKEDVDKVIIRKGKYNLHKASIDRSELKLFIKNSIQEGVNDRLKNITNELTSTVHYITEISKNIEMNLQSTLDKSNTTIEKLNKTNDKHAISLENYEDKFDKLLGQVEPIINELNTLID